MSKKLQTSEPKDPVATAVSSDPPEVFKTKFLKMMEYSDDPKRLTQSLREGLEKAYDEKNEKQRQKILQDLDGLDKQVLRALSLDSKYKLVATVEENDRSFALQMNRELEQEFDVKTPSEKALVQMATLAYCRYFDCANFFRARKDPKWLSHEAAHFVSIYAKEMDRSHRQFIAAIQALKAMKSPPLNIKVSTKTAFVAQNQQNISNPSNNAPQ